MEFEQLLELVGTEPVFESALLLAGKAKPDLIRLQLTRWTKSGRVYQLRRGLYALTPPYQKVKPHPFLIANRLQRASYVSGQSALAFYGMIPETVQVTLSLSTGRPEQLETALGGFEFRHVNPRLLHGYRMTQLSQATGMQPGQQALVAMPEKALLDLIYLQPGGETTAYLSELRLQNLEGLDLDLLQRQAELFNTPKLQRAVDGIRRLMQNAILEYETV
jgi:hypothetical protein